MSTKILWICLGLASTVRYDVFPEVWFICPVRLHQRKLMIFFLCKVLIKDSLLITAGNPCPLSQLSTRMSLTLCMPFAHCYSLCGFIYASILLWIHPPLAIAICLSFLPHSFLSPEWRGGLMKTTNLGLRAPISFILCTLSNCKSLCYFPLTTRGNFSNKNLWEEHNFVRNHFIAMFF